MPVFARCPPAATRSPPLMIVRSILGTNALHPRAAWAAGAPQIHGGTGLDSSRQRKAKAAGAIVIIDASQRLERKETYNAHCRGWPLP